jgi:MoxR-like ATPase
MSIDPRVAPLREALDRAVVGHDDAKQAILLAILCREHVYIEGPPGTAKTRMAEVASRASDLEFFFYQLHRDTRLPELVGDVVLERRQTEDGGELIHQRTLPGGILTAEVCVLDDISRAPGEALNVLLQILNERRFGEVSIPLLTAIATSNPASDEYYNEPLDPANLDRFAVQLRVSSLLGGDDQELARRLIDRFVAGEVREEHGTRAVCDRSTLDEIYAEIGRAAVPESVKDALLELFRALVLEHGCNETNSLLTARSFLVKSIKLLRGAAVLAGRDHVTTADLDVMRWMTTFRIPEHVHDQLPDMLGKIARDRS